MDIEKFDINDFLTDESFFKSVKTPNSKDGIFWETWLNNHPEKLELANQARKILLTVNFKDNSFNKQEITDLWLDIQQDTILAQDTHDRDTEITRQFYLWKYLKVAAVLLPFIIASILLLFYRDVSNEQNAPVSELIEKHNPKGQKLTIFLSDGSRIKLNAESKIWYQKRFADDKREVYLEGEAFFEVTHDENRPFIVHAGNLETKVLGTSFNIKAYPDDSHINVAVKTGRVSVFNTKQKFEHAHNKSVVLSPSEMATFSLKDEEMNVSNYNPKEVLSWSDGILYFNDATMEEFVAALERWYGCDIVVKRKQPIKKGIVGEFKNLSLEEILMGTHEACQFEYEFKNGKVIIK